MGISDRDSAIRQNGSLLEKGHRKKYREFISEMKSRGLLSLSEEELLARVERENGDVNEFQAAYRAYQAMGEKAVDAWDYSRALQVLGDCYQAEYISLEECLDQSLAVAKKLQEEFGSWDEVCESYLYGYHFWKKDDANYQSSDTAKRWEVYEELKEMEDGPFSVPYDTELKESWKNVEIKEEEEETPEKQEKGVYKLSDVTDNISVTVKTPKGFGEDIFGDGHTVFVERWGEKRGSIVTLMYDISEIVPEEDILYGVRLNRVMDEQNGAENTEVGEIQTLSAEGRDIYYVISSSQKDGVRDEHCDAWVMLDDKYMLNCAIGQDGDGGEFIYPDITELLKEIYGGIEENE